MDVMPSTDAPKRAKTKSKTPAQRSRKKPTISRQPSVAAQPAVRAVAIETRAQAPLDLRLMIEQAAFFMAAERGFAPGRELDDWLEAERRITSQYSA